MSPRAFLLTALFCSLAFSSCAATSLSPRGRPLAGIEAPGVARLFQNKFFLPDYSSDLNCKGNEDGALDDTTIDQVIRFYEADNVELAKGAVRVLTDHSNGDHRARVDKYFASCANDRELSRCVIQKYWNSRRDGMRALALFYDTGIVIRRGNGSDHAAFTSDQVMAIEKAIRKIPTKLREKMNRGSPAWSLDRYLIDGKTHLTFTASEAGTGGFLGAVAETNNGISFWRSGLEKARAGSAYKDIGLTFNVDFRMQMILHEVGHVVDCFNEDPAGKEILSSEWKCISKTGEGRQLIKSSQAAIWPSRWWDAFKDSFEVRNGRYALNEKEQFAEMFAQYILIPSDLQREAPEMYGWLKKNVFDGIEYEGYEQCKDIVAPLSRLQKLFVPSLR